MNSGVASIRPRTKNSAAGAEAAVHGIAIMGVAVTSGNRGVLALGASLITLCWEAATDATVILLLSNRDNTPARFLVGGKERLIPIVHARMSPRSNLQDHLFWIVTMSVMYRILPIAKIRTAIAQSTPWIRALIQTDLVGDVRGGDSFSDIYGMNRFLRGFFEAWTVVLVKGDIVQFPQTFGPFRNPLARWLARFLLNRSSVVIARDKKSQAIAQALVAPEKKVLLSPDVAFSLEPIQPEHVTLDPALPTARPNEIIGLNVNGLMYNGGYTRDNMFALKLDYRGFLRTLVTTLLLETTGELWLVPHTFAADDDVESDPAACRKLRDGLPVVSRDRVRVVTREYDQHEIKGVIGLCDFFIGSRMHACIAALSQGIPCVGIAYSGKFAGVFESVGMEEWVVDGAKVMNEEAVARTIELYRRRDSIRAILAQRAEAARVELRNIFWKLLRSGELQGRSDRGFTPIP